MLLAPRYGIADIVTRFRHRLGLSALSRHNSGWALYGHPTTFMWSSALLPRPTDWPATAAVAGCPVDTSLTVQGYSPPAELAAFLAAGEKLQLCYGCWLPIRMGNVGP